MNDITGLPTYHTRVERRECDYNDHWNMRFYGRSFQAASETIAAQGGLSNPGAATVRSRHMRFHGELRVSAPVEIRSAVLDRSDGAVVHHMWSAGKLAALIEMCVVTVDLGTRRAVAVPDFMYAALGEQNGTVDGGWGNGKACAAQFAREGARVICVDLDVGLAEEAARAIRDEGGKAVGLAGNATKSDDMKTAVAAAVEEYGRLDILLNNVGIVVRGGAVELPEEDWDRAFDVNLKSAFLSMKHAIPAMTATGGGSIVNISSISSLKYLNKPYVAYYTTKAAMNHMTRVTAAQYAPEQVRVNAILPGLMDTPMAKASAERNWAATPEKLDEYWTARKAQVPMGWLGDAFDIARAAVFLASDDARWITGQCLAVDGGTTLGL